MNCLDSRTCPVGRRAKFENWLLSNTQQRNPWPGNSKRDSCSCPSLKRGGRIWRGRARIAALEGTLDILDLEMCVSPKLYLHSFPSSQAMHSSCHPFGFGPLFHCLRAGQLLRLCFSFCYFGDVPALPVTATGLLEGIPSVILIGSDTGSLPSR